MKIGLLRKAKNKQIKNKQSKSKQSKFEIWASVLVDANARELDSWASAAVGSDR